ncbi:MAG: monooxygenase [Myxococcota bacterium]|jgi:monooxygenase
MSNHAGPEHLDVLIIGAGLSGIGAAYHLQTKCPSKRYAILEGRPRLGGTWDLFRYPGVRSDSDMYTLGYSFRPWTDPKSIADGPSILAYLEDTARTYGIDRKIRFGHMVVRSSWSSAEERWTVDVRDRATDTVKQITCSFLFVCSGYYRYAAGYTPDFEGVDRFGGQIVHPQHWTEDIAYAGKRVVVIGSGATAVTLVPELAKEAAHVTMLQRSPTYMFMGPAEDPVANWLDGKVPKSVAYPMLRWKNIGLSMFFYRFAKRFPERAKRRLVGEVRRVMGPDYDVDTHFTPDYDPWDQRVCLVPDKDLLESIKRGQASVVTDHIESFTETGLRLRSGAEVEADLVVTATGLHVEFFGGSEIVVDGRVMVPNETMSYRAMMLGNVPNMAFATGYTNASWTLKVDIVCNYVCRLLNHMDAKGYATCCPRPDPDMEEVPLLDFTAGYIQRALERLPRSGAKHPWRVFENYILDRISLDYARLEDGAMEFRRSAVGPGEAAQRYSSSEQ